MVKLSIDTKGVKEEDINSALFRKVNRIIAIKIAKIIAKYTKITPTQINIAVFLLNLLTAFLFYLGDYIYLVLGGITFLLLHLLDQVDGSLARIKDISKDYGTFIDHVSDTFGIFLIFIAASFGIFKSTNDPHILMLGFAAGSAHVMSNYMYEFYRRLFDFSTRFIEKHKSRMRILTNFFYDGNLIVVSLSFFAFINQLKIIIPILAVYGWIYCIIQFIVSTRKAVKMGR